MLCNMLGSRSITILTFSLKKKKTAHEQFGQCNTTTIGNECSAKGCKWRCNNDRRGGHTPNGIRSNRVITKASRWK